MWCVCVCARACKASAPFDILFTATELLVVLVEGEGEGHRRPLGCISARTSGLCLLGKEVPRGKRRKEGAEGGGGRGRRGQREGESQTLRTTLEPSSQRGSFGMM